MKVNRKSLYIFLLLFLLLGLVVVMVFFWNAKTGKEPAQSETTQSAMSPEDTRESQTQPSAPVQLLSDDGAYPLPVVPTRTPYNTGEPYPPPYLSRATRGPTETDEPLPSLTPTPLPPFPETLSYPAAVLYAGDLWLLSPGNEPQKLTGLGDVSVLFGWNHDGKLLLFGRGRWEHREFSPASTVLWLLEVATGQYRQVIPGNAITAADFSPMEDSIAYGDTESVLRIINLNGETLHQVERSLIGFTWSPDGRMIAVSAFTPDMVGPDTLTANVLGIWRPFEDRFELISEAKNESHSHPIWSLDSTQILFMRNSFPREGAKQVTSGIYSVDASIGEMTLLDETSINGQEMSRSPRANLVTFRLGSDIYIMDFQGNLKLVGHGQSLQWLPDGKTLSYLGSVSGIRTTLTLDVGDLGAFSGGDRPMTGFYLREQYIFIPEGD